MRALVLSGGGGRGAYQVGAIKHLLGDLNRHYPLVVGVSVGAVNGVELAQWSEGREVEAAASLEAMWRDLRTEDVVSERGLQPFSLLWETSTHSFDPLQRLLNERLDMGRLRLSGKRYLAVAVDIMTGDFRTYGTEERTKAELVRGILGSSATPILHPNIRTGSEVLYDGGIRDVSPIGQAIKLGATEIDLILCESPKLSKWDPAGPNRVWHTAPRVLEIMYRELVEADLDRVALYNAAVESGHAVGAGKKHIKLRVLRPAEPLPADPARFDIEQTEKLIALGERDARSMTW